MKMDTYSEKHSVQRILPEESGINYKNFIWSICTIIFLIVGASDAVVYSWSDETSVNILLPVIILLTVLCCAAGEWLRFKKINAASYSYIVHILPAAVIFIITDFRGYLSGAALWMNLMMQNLNESNNCSFVLFKINAAENYMFNFQLFLIFVICECAWHLVFKRRMILTLCFSAIWIILPAVGGTIQPVTAVCTAAAIMMIMAENTKRYILVRDLIWCFFIIAAAGMCSFMTSDGVSDIVDHIRTEMSENIYTMRYGQTDMVNGDMRSAAKLHESNDSMFIMKSEQEKDIYLRAFAAGDYDGGIWSELPYSVYSGKYAGMMEWLADKNFNPMTQTADYYRLSESSNVPEKNRISLDITNAGRENLYIPASLKKIYKIRYKIKNDSSFTSKGFVGARSYSYDEVSGNRPSELIVPESWVSSPENSSQKKYSEAESVYRQFVYDNYTSISRNLYDVVNNMFWKDYDDKNDSVYSAVCRVRDVLEKTVRYTDKPEAAPADSDPVIWFLKKECKGNAVMYAAAAVEALRAHGIPARYAEGYYISAADIEAGDGGEVNVSGKNMHAWAEVYFDGIGWMPVDVTPGYYYNITALQQMVSAPDSVRHTAAIEDEQSEFKDITDDNVGNTSIRESAVKKIENTAVMLAGAAAILIILCVMLLCIFEIVRIVAMSMFKRRYNSYSSEKRVLELEKRIFRVLELRGIEARLGWKTNETDSEIAEKCSNVKPREYLRVCAILEKAVYGETELEQYEERTLKTFLSKISQPEKSLKWTVCIKMHYMDI